MNRSFEFTSNVDTNRAALVKYITNKVNCVSDAEDILQRALMTMWKKYDTFDATTNFMSWACTIANFESKNTYRKHKRCPVVFDDVIFDDVSKYMLFDQTIDSYETLQMAIKQLDDVDRLLITAVHIDGEEVKDVAARTRKSPRTIYNRLCIARKKLAYYIQHHDNPKNTQENTSQSQENTSKRQQTRDELEISHTRLVQK